MLHRVLLLLAYRAQALWLIAHLKGESIMI